MLTPSKKPSALEMGAVDDDVLVARALAGDDAAFELIMRRHNRILFRTVRGIAHNDADAEDVLQEAWLAAYRALSTFRGEARLSTWLMRIAVNTALMRRRKNARDVVVPLRPQLDDNGAELGDMREARELREAADDVTVGPEETQLRMETRKLVEARIDELPEAFRIVFMLRVLEERSVEETAAVLGIPEATVRTRQFRARALLREALTRDLDVAVDGAFQFDGERCDRIVHAVLTVLTVLAGDVAREVKHSDR